VPHDLRLLTVERALRLGATPEQVYEATGIDPWFVDQLLSLVELRAELEALRARCRAAAAQGQADGLQRPADRRRARRVRAGRARAAAGAAGPAGLQDRRHLRGRVRRRDALPLLVLQPLRDGDESEVAPSGRRKVLILGSGPNRIGQGIEFDYACVHASFALRDAGFETVMVNCNPETVSTDYDTSDRLYFEPLTVEDVLEVVAAERESARLGGGELVGVIVQLGGRHRCAWPTSCRPAACRSSAPARGHPPG
jgi:carbamoyl-phosphate synthase large subunit